MGSHFSIQRSRSLASLKPRLTARTNTCTFGREPEQQQQVHAVHALCRRQLHCLVSACHRAWQPRACEVQDSSPMHAAARCMRCCSCFSAPCAACNSTCHSAAHALLVARGALRRAAVSVGRIQPRCSRKRGADVQRPGGTRVRWGRGRGRRGSRRWRSTSAAQRRDWRAGRSPQRSLARSRDAIGSITSWHHSPGAAAPGASPAC